MDSKPSNIEGFFLVKHGDLGESWCSMLGIYLKGKHEQNVLDGLMLAIVMSL